MRHPFVKYILVGALIGLGGAALILSVYCFVWFYPYANSGDAMTQGERSDMESGIARFGLVMFIYRAAPIGILLGAVAGAIACLLRKRWHTARQSLKLL